MAVVNRGRVAPDIHFCSPPAIPWFRLDLQFSDLKSGDLIAYLSEKFYLSNKSKSHVHVFSWILKIVWWEMNQQPICAIVCSKTNSRCSRNARYNVSKVFYSYRMKDYQVGKDERICSTHYNYLRAKRSVNMPLIAYKLRLHVKKWHVGQYTSNRRHELQKIESDVCGVCHNACAITGPRDINCKKEGLLMPELKKTRQQAVKGSRSRHRWVHFS